PPEHRMFLAQSNHFLYKFQKLLIYVLRVPVEPADLVVLAVRVVIAVLRVANRVAGEKHRHSLRKQQRCHEIAFLTRTYLPDLGILSRTFDSTVPTPVVSVPSRLSSPLASLCFEL